MRISDWSSDVCSSDLARTTSVVDNIAEKTGVNRMFAWFQRLLPRQGNFFELFESHAGTVAAGAEALARLLQGGDGMAGHIQEIVEREHDADAITREVLQTVRRTFLTPFDRSAISDLIASMDDARSEEHTSELQSLMRNSYAVFLL